METEEITRLVDGIYKNILDKFNPGARQLINAGKTYLKALHGAAAASKIYVDAIHKLARQAQQGTWGGSSDVGSALMQIVEVYKEIQNQQMNILKAFYVDLLVPLETNLEKDTKVVQSEQKRFLQQHKQRSESYSKAAATMKKQRKKNKGTTKTGLAMDKEVKNMQVLEEERSKLDAFCEQSLKTAMTQERRRYGFVLERQCSLAKHYLAYHTQGSAVLAARLEDWQDVAQTREYLPDNVDSIFTNKLRQVSFWPDEDVYSSPRSPMLDDDRMSIASQLRKTKSMDASCLDVRCINDATMKPLSRAKSDFNLTASTTSLIAQIEEAPHQPRPKSIAVPWESHLQQQPPVARALYAYLSSGDNQLSFLEGDVIALMGDRNKGWQFGENLRTQASGWFPLAYTELIADEAHSTPTHQRLHSYDSSSTSTSVTTPATPTVNGGVVFNSSGVSSGGGHLMSPVSGGSRTIGKTTALIEPRPSGVTMFGDTLAQRSAAAKGRPGGGANACPPPQLPAPAAPRAASGRLPPPPMPPLPPLLLAGGKRAPGVAGGNVSLHSSNDSGFSNDPPPAPDVDYSDDENSRKPSTSRRRKPVRVMSSVRGWLLYKSALDLWDDVNSQEAAAAASTLRPAAAPASASVKRSKSLWRFRKPTDIGVVDGMSLWQHRSLVDVRDPEKQEKKPTTKMVPVKDEKKVEQEKDLGYETVKDCEDDGLKVDFDAESCLVVDDHLKTATLLPRTKLSKNVDSSAGTTLTRGSRIDELARRYEERGSKTELRGSKFDLTERGSRFDLNGKVESYALSTLMNRGSRFDERSQTTGNMCGPWYDLWGVDQSVKT